MKKLTLLLALFLLAIVAKSQTPTLNTLIRFVNAPVADVTEQVISINGWELTKSELVDSVVRLQFDHKEATLLIKKVKNYSNDVILVCNKSQYENLNRSLLQLKPKLINSEVNEKGHIVKTYWGETYGYRISIAPKSLFSFHIYDKANSIIKELFENLPDDTASIEGESIQDSKLSITPLKSRTFTKLVLPRDYGEKTGKIAVRIKFNQTGSVIDAVAGVMGTTLNDRELWKKCEVSMKETKISSSNSAPLIQGEIVIFHFKNN